MPRVFYLLGALLLAGLLCSCRGSTTTLIDPVDLPAIGPEGVFNDLLAESKLGRAERFRFLVSSWFIHAAVFPNRPRGFPESQAELEEEATRLEAELKPVRGTVETLIGDYMTDFRERSLDYFFVTREVSYDIRYRDSQRTAEGPNTAVLTVALVKRGAGAKEGENAPEINVSFIQDGDLWRVFDITPDRLKGRFSRP